MIFDITTR